MRILAILNVSVFYEKNSSYHLKNHNSRLITNASLAALGGGAVQLVAAVWQLELSSLQAPVP